MQFTFTTPIIIGGDYELDVTVEASYSPPEGDSWDRENYIGPCLEVHSMHAKIKGTTFKKVCDLSLLLWDDKVNEAMEREASENIPHIPTKEDWDGGKEGV
jgi:hypothetical protein